MGPREFLKRYEFDSRLVTGEYFPSEPLELEAGDKVGVVLLNLGGPDTVEQVEPFLYNLFMDPAIIDIPVGGILRHWLCRYVSSSRSKKVATDYEMIGGGSPINHLTREQAASLNKHLNTRFGEKAGVEFKTYVAMRYWHPLSEDAAAEMQKDGINKVVLLPLYPQYSKTTTGSSLIYWHALKENKEIPDWPTTYVFEYAANPKYIQSVSERIDEALQRFPKNVRDQVHLVFSAHGTPLKEMTERRDPYCCLVNSSVDRVMTQRGFDRPFHVAFQSKVGPGEWLSPSTPDKLEELAGEGVRSVLMIPIAFVTDHVETAYELDIEVRLVTKKEDDAGAVLTAAVAQHVFLRFKLFRVAVDKADGGPHEIMRARNLKQVKSVVPQLADLTRFRLPDEILRQAGRHRSCVSPLSPTGNHHD